jgi:hypothetical protein
MDSGDFLLLYSDGLVEAHDRGKCLDLSACAVSPNSIVGSKISLIRNATCGAGGFTGESWEQEDDITW